MGTIICGIYKGNPVMILARENDKSTPIQNKKYNGSNIEGVYEDFGGATKKREVSESNSISEPDAEETAIDELFEETAGLINLKKGELEKNLNIDSEEIPNYIDFFPDSNDPFGIYRMYFIRLSNEIITKIIDENKIAKNYNTIIKNITSISSTKLDYNDGSLMKSIRAFNPNPTTDMEKDYSKIKSFLEINDIGIFELNPSSFDSAQKPLPHPFMKDETMKAYTIQDIYSKPKYIINILLIMI